jgi:hypothetical protein
MFTDHLFYLKADLLVAAIVDQAFVHDKDVSRTHQSSLRHVGRVHFAGPHRREQKASPVGMILGNCHSERQKLHDVL